MLFAVGGTGRGPDGTRDVPEIDGGVVGDEEDFAVDAFVVERDDVGSGGVEEGDGCKEVAVGDVDDVGEVEEVFVVADLDAGFAFPHDLDHLVGYHRVAFAEDAGGPDGGGKEFGVAGAVGG